LPTSSRPDPTDPVTQYAHDVTTGRIIACRLVRLACERHLRDLVEGPGRGLRWNAALASWTCEFFRLFRHSKGEFAGRRLKLEPWQAFIVGSVFGWTREDGTRRFRKVFEEIPRKNGKSTKLAGVGIFSLIADGEAGAEVYAAATKKDQARIVFDEARRMVRGSPDLSAAISVFKLNMSVENTASKFEPLSADEKTLDGLNPSTVIIDELHKHKTRAVLDVLDTAQGARRQPLLWIITTAGSDDPETVYAAETDYATKVLEGIVEDDGYFAFIAQADDPERWDDPIEWAKANPNLGVSVRLSYLEQQARQAKGSPARLATFKRLHLDLRTSSTVRPIPAELWNANTEGPIDLAALRGRECFVGADLSTRIDLTAAVKLFPPIAAGERWKILARMWMPEDMITEAEKRDRAPYRQWVEEGWIEASPGNVIDQELVAERIIADAEVYPPLSIGFDPNNANWLDRRLADVNLPRVAFPQTILHFNPPTKELLALLKQSALEHGGNPVLRWMASNVAFYMDGNENMRPSKKSSRARIDGIVALIMAIGRSMSDERAPTPSIMVL
jgi:phage terminase large subunit-like protein